MEYIDLKLMVNAVLFSIIGIVIFLVFSWIYDKLIGLSIIIAFAHG
mgnify:CR=1 FL=1